MAMGTTELSHLHRLNRGNSLYFVKKGVLDEMPRM